MKFFCCFIALVAFTQGQKYSNGTTFLERRKRNTETAWKETEECPEFPGQTCRHVQTKQRTVGKISLTCYVAIGNQNTNLLPTVGFSKHAERFVDSLTESELDDRLKVQDWIADPPTGETIFPLNHPSGRFRLDWQNQIPPESSGGTGSNVIKFADLQIQLNAGGENKRVKPVKGRKITSIAEVQVQFADVYDNPVSGMFHMYSDRTWSPVVYDVAKALKMSLKDQATAYVWYVQNNPPTAAPSATTTPKPKKNKQGKKCGNRRNARSDDEVGESCPIDFSNRGTGDLSQSLKASQGDWGGGTGGNLRGTKRPKKKSQSVAGQSAGGRRKNGGKNNTKVGRPRKKGTKVGRPKKKGTKAGRQQGTKVGRPRTKGNKSGRPRKKGTRAGGPKKKGIKSGRPNKKGTKVGRPKKKGSNVSRPTKKGTKVNRPKKKGTRAGRPRTKGTKSAKPRKKGTKVGRPKKTSTRVGRPKKKGTKVGSGRQRTKGNEVRKQKTKGTRAGRPPKKGRRNKSDVGKPRKKGNGKRKNSQKRIGRPKANGKKSVRPNKNGKQMKKAKKGRKRNNDKNLGRPKLKTNGMKTKNGNRRGIENRQGSVQPRPKKQKTSQQEDENGEDVATGMAE